MSTFSSVIHKPGKKFAPKAAPRRSVQRAGSQNATAQPSIQSVPSSEFTAPPKASIEVPPATSKVALPDIAPSFTSTPVVVLSSAAPHAKPTPFPPAVEPPTISSSSALVPSVTQLAARETETRVRRDLATPPEVKANKNATVEPRKPAQLSPVQSLSSQRAKRKRVSVGAAEAVPRHAPPTSLVTSTSIDRQLSSARKKRKPTPHAAPTLIFAQGIIASPLPVPDQPARETRTIGSRSSPRRTQSTDSLLQKATTRAAEVSTLADEIEGRTRSTRRQSQRKRPADAPALVIANIISDNDAETDKSRRRKRQKKTLQQVAAELVADAVGEAATDEIGKRKRRSTPDGAKDHEIEPAEIKMGELCKGGRLGKKSTRETAMQAVDWDEVKKQRKEEASEAQKRRENSRRERNGGRPEDEEPPQQHHIQMEIVDGNIVVVEESRVVDRQAQAERAAANPDRPVIEEKDITKRVNQMTVGRRSGVGPGTRWDEEMTDLFYKGLRMFGTDFMMISKMFPAMSRKHVKLKYVREERMNLDRVHENLAIQEPVDLGEYERMTDEVFEDPKKVQEEMEADEKRLRAEDETRRIQEFGPAHVDEETVLQSREQGSAEPTGVEAGAGDETTAIEGDASAKENRFGSVARRIVQEAVAPKSKRKQSGPTKKKDATKRGKRPLEGVEERLGPIDEVSR